MIGILLLTHGALAEGILNSAEMIAGKNEKIGFVSLQPGMTTEHYKSLIIDQIDKLDNGNGVLALVDILGGTPFNVVCSLMRSKNISVLTGLNLGMVLTAALENGKDVELSEMTRTVSEAGLDSIKIIELP